MSTAQMPTFQLRLQLKGTQLRTMPSVVRAKEPCYEVVSMFSGCGGMDLGFLGGFEVFGRYYERLPFKIVWANEHNEAACRTYSANLNADIPCGDVWDAMGSLSQQTDGLIRGFPCRTEVAAGY